MRSLRFVHATKALVLFAILSACAGPEPLSAQDVRGVAVLRDGMTPAAGGIVEAVLESDPRVRVRALVGFFMICGLPLDRLLRFHAVSGMRVSPTRSLRLRRERAYEEIRLGIEFDK